MLTDFHTHVLPCVDDGSGSVEESLRMLELSWSQGIRRVVATPHFYAGRTDPDRFLEARAESAELLAGAMAGNSQLPEVKLGAEVHYYRAMSETEELHRLAIQDSNFILVEMPMAHWTDNMLRELELIRQRQGLIPIVAHVDRYIEPWRKRGIPEALEALPVLVQANAGAFLRRTSRSMALKMLKKGQIQLLGSDCHNMESRRPCLGEAAQIIRRSLGDEGLQSVYEAQSRVFPEESIL